MKLDNQRSQLEKLRDRLLKQELSLEAKILLVQDLLKGFEFMDEESLQKFRSILKQYSADEIVAAIARFRAQVLRFLEGKPAH